MWFLKISENVIKQILILAIKFKVLDNIIWHIKLFFYHYKAIGKSQREVKWNSGLWNECREAERAVEIYEGILCDEEEEEEEEEEKLR